uniref:Major facilitator superfamily (MFS) profile domain-containing protein n=1 Tax=Panagrolaimus superbus TaxID=310955 RepID=A0A914YIK0_9BILA
MEENENIPKIVEQSATTMASRFTIQRIQDDSELPYHLLRIPLPLENDEKSNCNSNKSTTSARFIASISGQSWTRSREDLEVEDTVPCCFGYKIRFTIMLISTLCLSSILSNILTFNFTFICMAGKKPSNFENLTRQESEALGYRQDLDYDSVERSILFCAVAIGAIVAVFPTTILLNKYGSRFVFGALGLISATATLMIPMAANTHFYAMIAARMIQGMAFSACLPVMGMITSHWSTMKQTGIFIAILSSFLQIAPIFTMPISGELCASTLGWESVYYLHAIVGFLLFTKFMLYHRNKPHKHPMVRNTELIKVMVGKETIFTTTTEATKNSSKKVPYAAMYKDSAIWGILVAAFGNFMGTQLSLQFMPTYINKVLGFDIVQTGMASAISPVIMFVIKICAGQSSDRIKFIGDTTKLRIYNTFALGGMGTLFIILSFCDPNSHGTLCLCLLIASTCILGFNSGGFFKSSQMVSRQHSHFTMANISFINCFCMLLTPLLNEIIAPENAIEDWKIVLCIHGSILLITNFIFCVFCSSEPAKWTQTTTRLSANTVAPKSSQIPAIIQIQYA